MNFIYINGLWIIRIESFIFKMIKSSLYYKIIAISAHQNINAHFHKYTIILN